MQGWATPRTCSHAAHSRKGAAQRNLVLVTAQRCAAQRLVTALRQDGSALRAESCAGPRTPFRSAPGFRGRAAGRHFGLCRLLSPAQDTGSPLRCGRDDGGGGVALRLGSRAWVCQFTGVERRRGSRVEGRGGLAENPPVRIDGVRETGQAKKPSQALSQSLEPGTQSFIPRWPAADDPDQAPAGQGPACQEPAG